MLFQLGLLKLSAEQNSQIIMGGLINFALKTLLRLNEDDDANMM
jgi:hypothetical protein